MTRDMHNVWFYSIDYQKKGNISRLASLRTRPSEPPTQASGGSAALNVRSQDLSRITSFH